MGVDLATACCVRTACLFVICICLSAAQQCSTLLSEFHKYNTKEAKPFTGENMVYFLHIPRTAGRTFHACFLKQAIPASKRCPRAYDHLRVNFTVPSCHLLSSHDDFSVVERLPVDTAVVSQFRDPVDRFLSAYEFAIEVAARQLRRPANYKKPPGRVITDDVWPWSHLIPFFVDDIRPKVRKPPLLRVNHTFAACLDALHLVECG